jgi:GAF domain-containing protein
MSAEVGGPGQSAEERLRWLEAVSEAGLAELTVDRLLDELLEKVCDLMWVDTAAVLLLDSSHNFLIATVARGIEEEVHQGVRIPLGGGFAGRIAGERHWVAISQVDHDNVLNPILREKGIVSLLGVPLIAAGELLGVLHVGTLSRRDFTEQDAELLQIVAYRAAQAIQFRISRNEHAAALVMQRNLLPARLPEITGFESLGPLAAPGPEAEGARRAGAARSAALMRRRKSEPIGWVGSLKWANVVPRLAGSYSSDSDDGCHDELADQSFSAGPTVGAGCSTNACVVSVAPTARIAATRSRAT